LSDYILYLGESRIWQKLERWAMARSEALEEFGADQQR
jgi:hypothetical protein